MARFILIYTLCRRFRCGESNAVYSIIQRKNLLRFLYIFAIGYFGARYYDAAKKRPLWPASGVCLPTRNALKERKPNDTHLQWNILRCAFAMPQKRPLWPASGVCLPTRHALKERKPKGTHLRWNILRCAFAMPQKRPLWPASGICLPTRNAFKERKPKGTHLQWNILRCAFAVDSLSFILRRKGWKPAA